MVGPAFKLSEASKNVHEYTHQPSQMPSNKWHIIRYSFLFQCSPHTLSRLYMITLVTCIQRRRWVSQLENMYSTQTCSRVKTLLQNRPSSRPTETGLNSLVKFWNLRSQVDGTSTMIL